MEAALDERLDSALSGVVLPHWRLHLETPGVQATVPMLRGVWGAAVKVLSESLYQRLFVGGEVGSPRYVLRPAPREPHPARAVEFLLFGPPDRQDDDTVWAAWDRTAAADSGLNGVLSPCARFVRWFGTVRRRAPAGPGQGFPSTRCPGQPVIRTALADWSSRPRCA